MHDNKKNKRAAAILLVLATLLAGCHDKDHAALPTPPVAVDPYPDDDTLRLNQLQVLGTHNSYHDKRVEADDLPRYEMFQDGNSTYSAFYRILLWPSFNYHHASLTEQLDAGVRQLELDVWADPDGGAWSTAPLLLGNHPDFTFGVPELDEPGIKVFHMAQIDQYSSCWTLQACLQEIDAWSDAHPGHAPLTVMIEVKDEDTLATSPGIAAWTAADYDALDDEIRAVIAAEKLITPDEVQGPYATLKEAVVAGNWPTLRESRGRILFANCACLTSRHATDYLVAGTLAGRVMFPNSASGVTSAADAPDTAAFFVVPDAVTDSALIGDLVSAGFLVQTRADIVSYTGFDGDISRRDAALASGAHFVSTDFEVPDTTFGTGYSVAIPGGTPAGCNPVTGATGCEPGDIETPSALAIVP